MTVLETIRGAGVACQVRILPPEEEPALPDLANLQEALGVAFNDPSLLRQALVHRSYVNEAVLRGTDSNERLEFLGDAVVGFAVASKLYHDHPELAEGTLTRIRAALVSNQSLARLGTSLKLGDYLYLGRGEEASGGRLRETTLARAVEAVVGAIFLDQGMPGVNRLLERGLDFQAAYAEGIASDCKSQLQEITQARHLGTPYYRTVSVQGPDHRKEFLVEVLVGDRVLGKGKGRSKQAAQKQAASEALTNWEANILLLPPKKAESQRK